MQWLLCEGMITMNIIIKVAIIVTYLFSVGCSSGSANTVDKARLFFNKHYQELHEIKQTLLKHPNIERVSPGRKLEFTPSYKNFSSEDIIAYKALIAKCEELDVLNITNYRIDNNNGEKLLIIRYVIYSIGLSPSGRSVSINFIPNQLFVERLEDNETTYYPLDVVDWYVAEYISNN